MYRKATLLYVDDFDIANNKKQGDILVVEPYRTNMRWWSEVGNPGHTFPMRQLEFLDDSTKDYDHTYAGTAVKNKYTGSMGVILKVSVKNDDVHVLESINPRVIAIRTWDELIYRWESTGHTCEEVLESKEDTTDD